ncbi:hypothetical protein [Ruminococcus sp. NK3A76]|uniref:putative ABC transporter permease n=1 Tax=Ruminococcus sp. NK3A76 TaxID=877411 RepID=UPI00068EE816|nr:hypothetical protein [Ruminococcus sp. NK3A76]
MTRARLEGVCVFFTGAFCYGLCELIARGRTHITMGLLGGVAMLFIHFLGEKRRNGMLIITAMAAGALFITAVEYIAGLILNISLGLAIWDYSSLALNYRGQICIEYSLKWGLITLAGMLFDELLRVFVFKDKAFVINKPVPDRIIRQLKILTEGSIK